MIQSAADVIWNANKISDENYKVKFKMLPEIIKSWFGDLNNKEILDFGCGEATTALGIALEHGAKRVVGIDIMPDPELCAPNAEKQLGMRNFPSNLFLHRVSPGKLHSSFDKFDLIYSWSVFEHVEQKVLPEILETLRCALKLNGCLFIQIAPLFYSSDGSHLMYKVPEPWGHLSNQSSIYLEKLRAACANDDEFRALKSMYETLNRLTASQLVKLVNDAGFKIVREYRTERNDGIPAEIIDVYNRDILLNEQIVILATKNS